MALLLLSVVWLHLILPSHMVSTLLLSMHVHLIKVVQCGNFINLTDLDKGWYHHGYELYGTAISPQDKAEPPPLRKYSY